MDADEMDVGEQELAEIQSAFTRGMAASNGEYLTKMNAQAALLGEQLRGASDEEQKRIREEYEQRSEAILQESIERGRELTAIHVQRINALYKRLRNTPNDTVSPFWRVSVSIAEEAPAHVHSFFQRKSEIYSIEALRECMQFFLDHPDETRWGSPIEVEVIRVTHEESVISLKGREVEDRAVYHLDFRLPEQRDLIGHDHLQKEVIGAWVSVGCQC